MSEEKILVGQIVGLEIESQCPSCQADGLSKYAARVKAPVAPDKFAFFPEGENLVVVSPVITCPRCEKNFYVSLTAKGLGK